MNDAEDKQKENKDEKARTVVEKAEAAKAGLEKATEDANEVIQKAEDIKAKEILSGKAEAGQAPPSEPEETAKEYADKVMKGEVKPK